MTARVDRDCILHLGVMKTGTTSIQHAFNVRRDTLLAHGVCYPRSPGAQAHYLFPASLAPTFANHPGLTPLWLGMDPLLCMDNFWAAFGAEMAALPDTVHQIIISSETFSTLLQTPDQVAAVAARLAPWCTRVRVIVYIRRQDQFRASLYSQLLREGLAVHPELPIDRPAADYYLPMLTRWASVFGQSAITPRIYDRAELVGGDVVTDFATLCGIDPAMLAGVEAERNVSITETAQAVLCAAAHQFSNQTGARPSPAVKSWRHTVEIIDDLAPGRGWRPTQADARAYMLKLADNNEAVRAQWFPARAHLFSDNFDDLPQHLTPPTADAISALAVAALVSACSGSVRLDAAHAMAQYRAYNKLNDTRGMRTCLQRILAEQPDFFDANLEMARFYLARGKFAVARVYGAALRRIDPDNALTARLNDRLDREEDLAARAPAATATAAHPTRPAAPAHRPPARRNTTPA